LFNQNLISTKKKLAVPFIIGLILLITLPSLAMATPPYPTSGAATVDGNIAEWNLTNDFFANMYRAGKDDKVVESILYLRYDLSSQTMYVLVLTEPGVPALTQADDAWVAIDEISNKVVKGNSGNDATPPDFAWVNPTNGNAEGYEASFKISPRDEPHTIMVHIQVYDDCEAQTSSTIKIGLQLFVVPETLIATTLIATLAAGGVFMFHKKRTKTPQINTI